MSLLKHRIFLTGIGVTIFLISYSVGANIQLDQSSAQKLKEAFLHKINGLNYLGIFTNNLIITIIMFLPGIGALFGIFSGYSTGTIFSSITHDSTSHSYISPLVILLTPFGMMEVFCYGLAISRSFILLFSLVKKENLAKQLKSILIEIGIILIILFLAAIIEWHFISTYNNTKSQISTP
jgi:uncharacterized membrane protein SpoIIM required for sporulation